MPGPERGPGGKSLKQKPLFNATPAVQQRILGFTCRRRVFPIYTRKPQNRRIKFNRAAFADKASASQRIRDDRGPVCSLLDEGIGDTFAQESLNYAKF